MSDFRQSQAYQQLSEDSGFHTWNEWLYENLFDKTIEEVGQELGLTWDQTGEWLAAARVVELMRSRAAEAMFGDQPKRPKQTRVMSHARKVLEEHRQRLAEL